MTGNTLISAAKAFKCSALWCLILLTALPLSNAILRRCYQCRSRGELGSCKDPFKLNATQTELEHGVTAIPCASGWCGKVIEGTATDDFDMATQRMCVQRGPSDSEDRCANTIYNHKKVFMCFCQGDLCNASPGLGASTWVLVIASSLVVLHNT